MRYTSKEAVLAIDCINIQLNEYKLSYKPKVHIHGNEYGRGFKVYARYYTESAGYQSDYLGIGTARHCVGLAKAYLMGLRRHLITGNHQ